MKKIFSLLFIAGVALSLFVGNAEGAFVGIAGLTLTQFLGTKMQGYAFFTIVPGKFVVQNPAQGPGSPGYGQLQEVPYMTRAEKALYDQLITLNRSNPVTQEVIRQGGISFDPITYYIRAIITGQSGRQQIVNNSLIQITGITNIPNGGSLPQFYNFCFDRIAVRYAVTASASANAAAVTGFSSIRANMPAALGNGHLIVTSNQNKILETPISDFTSVAAITGGGERDYDGGVLEKPRFFLELINIEVEIAYSTGQVVPSAANNTYTVEVMFFGTQARLKA
ncbi:MAG TPA: hypothetical protein VK589_30005 [Chryseolinea sp.]|nr:hypothetical protein [Chryseolinea sp.]